MAAYYNEIEPYAAEWLRNLIKAGHIADGEVDTRSIVDVHPFDLQGFDQCHFFAGIGGWSHAFRLAGWPDSRPVWTGSCPCQPFSVAGQGGGVDDPRHLWPHFFRLIRAVRPPVVLGEQVAGKAGYGWLDGVRADLEREDYASRGVDLPALAVNAPHIRQRLYWIARDMADTSIIGREERKRQDRQQDTGSRLQGGLDTAGADQSDVADANDGGWQRRPRDGDCERDGKAGERYEDHGLFAGCGEDRGDLADSYGFGRQARQRDTGDMGGAQRGGESEESKAGRLAQTAGGDGEGDGGQFWADAIWLPGTDGKLRRVKPGLPLLAHGVPGRVGKLRAYGNAIVPPLAAEVIKAFMMGDDRWM